MADKLLCLGKHLATKGMSNGSSPAADRGTECHEWAEELIFNQDAAVPDFVEDWQEQCTRDMVAHALEVYDELSVMGDVILKVEEQVNLGWVRPDGPDKFDLSQVYGTCDVTMFCPDTGELVILDYKTGKGIEVSPVDNVQMMIYAVGGMALFNKEHIIKKIRIVVSQPRINKERLEWHTTPNNLIMWVHETLTPALEAMSKPGAPKTPGKKQCQWCAIAGTCDVQRQEMLDMFDSVPEPAQEDDIQVLNDLLLRHNEFKQWLNQLEGRAQGLMEEGKELPDFKLVRGRGSRAWTDEEAAEKFLMGQKLKKEERYTYKLLTPPQAEKVLKNNLKRTVTKNNFDRLVDKKEGQVTWALKSDKREEVNMKPPVDMLIDLESI